MKYRTDALIWWNAMTWNQCQQICNNHTDVLKGARKFTTLTGREIEKLYISINGKPLEDIPNRY